MKNLSLKTRFAIVMTVGALALVVVMGAVTTWFAQDDLLKTLSTEQLDMVAKVADDLDANLRFAVETMTSSAKATPLDVAMNAERFNAFYAQYPTPLALFEQVFVIDTSGKVVSAYPQQTVKLVGLDLSDRRYFNRVMAFAKPVVSDPLRGRVTGMPIIDIAAPMLDADGNVVAVMVGVLPLTRRNFLGAFAHASIGKTGYFTVMTTWPDPIYLAHPDEHRLMQPVSREKSQATAKMLNATRPASLVSTLADGSEALVTYQPLTTSNWVLAAILPREEAFATIAHARGRAIDVALIAALVMLPLVWFFAWILFRPLSRLRREVEAIAGASDSVAFATVGHHDEVAEVAVAFNAMLAGQRASEALRLASDQDRRRLVAILESSQDFVAISDVKGNLTYLNAAARAVCGIGINDDVSRISVQACMPPWAIEKLRREGVRSALRDGIWLGEMAVLDRFKREVPVDQTVIAHRNAHGRLDFFSTLLHDTSAAQAAAASVRVSEARMLSIADALPVLVSYIDRDFRYHFVNSRYEDHFGLDKSFFIGKTVHDVLGDTAYAVYRPFLERGLLGEAQEFEIESHAGTRAVHFFVKLIPQYDAHDHVAGFHFIHQDVTDHKAENRRLSQLARADALTGLLNRSGFETAISDAMARSRHHLAAMALFYLDVDRFKATNDQHGHQIGDKLLRGFAARLVRAVRSNDVVARLGGDEFVVIAQGVKSVDDVRSIAGKILRAMRPDFDFSGTTLSITTSIGVAIYAGEEATVDDLVKRADNALYRAKDAGRNCYALDDEMQTFGTTTLLSEHPELAT
jgi:diguanylate cyclase (GGDEF)-like protein/PAS domain S-box-containing protein